MQDEMTSEDLSSTLSFTSSILVLPYSPAFSSSASRRIEIFFHGFCLKFFDLNKFQMVTV